MVSFENVLAGIVKYLDQNIYAGMNDWQEVLARIAVSRVIESAENVKASLVKNNILKTFCVVDSEGNIDVERIAADLKREIDQKNSICVTIPVFGKYKFSSSDVNELTGYIMEACDGEDKNALRNDR